MLLQHKKGISEMISYTLLVIIAVGLSVGVYAFLKIYIPKASIECPNGIALILKEVSCKSSNNILEVTLENKGLRTVDAVYIRIGVEGRKVREWINDPEKTTNDDFYLLSATTSNVGLLPGESTKKTFIDMDKFSPGKKILEIEPAAITENNKLAICTDSIVIRTIQCIN
ncbi:MAG: hypothetical protein AABW65_00495 [Nanoarchaeota archaeon]